MQNTAIEPGSYIHRFGGIARLYSLENLEILRKSHIIIVGIGGVGSWTAEALARTGIGTLTLIDWDDICYSNSNRQIHAMTGNTGKSKVDILSKRISLINPECNVNPIRDYYTKDNAHKIIDNHASYVVDAIDRKNTKIHLLNYCKKNNLPIITCGGAGGKTDPSCIKICDLGESDNDPLLAQIRKQLRRDFNLPKQEKVCFDIPCVYSNEPMRYPTCDGNITLEKPAPSDSPKQLDCVNGFGSTTHVTGCFGFFMASFVINSLIKSPI